MGEGKRTLLGLHDFEYRDQLEAKLKKEGYEVEHVHVVGEIVQKTQKKMYSICIMDINLGYPMSEDITPAKTVYRALLPQIQSGEILFIALSRNKETIEAAKQANIPAASKDEFDVRDFIEG